MGHNAPTKHDQTEIQRYSGHGLGADCIIIVTVDVDPLLGAFGSTGADAMIGLGAGHCGVKG
jgi:hypothetical protein